MGYMVYNDIALQVESFQRFDQRAVYSDDGADYLYTEFVIVSRSFWHPVISSTAPPPAGSLISAVPPQPASTMMNNLRSSLLTPRKQLSISSPVGGDASRITFLRSPLFNPNGVAYPTDAKLGPQPLFCNVQQIIGEEAMIVDFGIMTWINECPGTSTVPINPVLSHRWAMSHIINEMQHTKRIVAGSLILRSDLCYNANGTINIKPDDFRDWIFHNIPPNYRRVGVNVEASSDGTRLDYSIEDQEVDGVVDKDVFQLAEVAHIEGTYSEVNQAAPGVSVGEALQNTQAGAITGAVASGALSLFGAPGIAGGAAALAATIAAGSFPARMFEVNIRVQGTRRATRVGLVLVAIRAAAGFRIGSLGQPDPGVVKKAIRALAELFLVSNSIQVGLVEKWVQLRLTYKSGGISSFVHRLLEKLGPGTNQIPANQGPNQGPTPPAGPNFGGDTLLPQGDPGPQTQVFQAAADDPSTTFPITIIDNPTFPDFLSGVTKSEGTVRDSYGPRGGTLAYGVEKGSRGTTIAHLLTAALNAPCVVKPQPNRASEVWNSPNYNLNQARSTLPTP